MIHYQLQCARGHGFDGWFRSSGAFDSQAREGLVECPACGDRAIERALMTPSVAKRLAFPAPAQSPSEVPSGPGAGARGGPPAPVVPAGVPTAAGGRLPDHMRAMLQKVRAEIERNCDYVGTEFADEARRIHHGESEARGIYGEATPEEARSLADEGIQIASVPWVPRADG